MAQRFVNNIMGRDEKIDGVTDILKQTNTFDGKPILNRRR